MIIISETKRGFTSRIGNKLLKLKYIVQIVYEVDLAEISTASSDSYRLKKGFLGVNVTLKAGSTGITNKHKHQQILLPQT